MTQISKIDPLPLFRRQKVGFVDEKEITPETAPGPLFAFGALDIRDVGLQILTSKIERVSRIDDLYDEVRTL